MKPRVYVGAAVAALVVGAWFWPGSQTPKAAAEKKQPAGFEVHEWGTFTSMQGAPGSSLEGLHHEEEALPAFVHRVVETPVTHRSQGKSGIFATRVSEKMETPVIYFYSDKKMNAQVRVDYSSGVMSEWFPAATHTWRGRDASSHILDVSRVRGSSLRWDVELTPRSSAPPKGIPAVSSSDPWSFARDVDASYVRDPRTGESDHYLFYRGLGRSQIAIEVEQLGEDGIRVHNKTGYKVPAAFVLEVNGNKARAMSIGGLPASGAQASPLVNIGAGESTTLAAAATQLKKQVEDALVATGLFRKEAKAMVKTWSRSWFESEGARLIYLVPTEVVDNMLPLTITPKPDALVRTLVGRLEYVKPSVAQEVALAVRGRFSSNKKTRSTSIKRLARLGRYLEPHLRRLIAGEKDAKTLKNAKRLLAEIEKANRPTHTQAASN